MVKFSECGQFLVASSTEGHVLVWKVANQQLLSCLQTDEKHHICSLDWSPELPQIAFCDTNGNFGTVDLQISTYKVCVWLFFYVLYEDEENVEMDFKVCFDNQWVLHT